MPPAKEPVKGDSDFIDPSALTTQQLLREVTLMKELLEQKFQTLSAELHGKNNTIETRLGAMDKAIELVREEAGRFPTAMDEKIEAVRKIHEEKFVSVQTQFKERDVRSEQSSKDSKVAVDAALQAAKEAVGEQNKSSAMAISKSETATVKQIDQQAALIQQFSKAVDDKFADVKERVTRIEGNVVISKSDNGPQPTANVLLLALGVASVFIVGAIITVGIMVARHP